MSVAKMGLSLEDTTKTSHEEFIGNAITTLRTKDYKGIHSVFSGFNQAFKQYFGEEPVDVTTRLSKEGKARPQGQPKGGVMLYLPEDAPGAVSVDETFKKIGLTPGDTVKVSHEEFVKKAITSLRREGYKGIHSVFSGFNQAFKQYFGEEPVDVTTRLSKEGKIATRPTRGESCCTSRRRPGSCQRSTRPSRRSDSRLAIQ